MSYILIDKNGDRHEIDNINMAGRGTITRPSDVVVSFSSASELTFSEYDVQPSLPHDSLKIITRVRVTNKVARKGGWGYVTTAIR